MKSLFNAAHIHILLEVFKNFGYESSRVVQTVAFTMSLHLHFCCASVKTSLPTIPKSKNGLYAYTEHMLYSGDVSFI